MEGGAFRHRVFSRAHPASGALHVYIDGDGRAWRTRTSINRDPTDARPLMLELIGLDQHPSLYVGRPCYLGLADSPGCEPRQWTSDRYSADVLESLRRVIESAMAEGDYEQLVLFGHSGGGTLATLLASRLPRTTALVTIAANLDVAAWAELHGYTPLTGSLNPALTGDFPPSGIFQVHWFGSADDEVPLALVAKLEPHFSNGELRMMAGFTHRCCWSEMWPEQLAEVAAYLAALPIAP